MKRVEVLTLVAVTETRDAINQAVLSETSSDVYCTIKSVTRSEWVAASQRSLAPEAVAIVFHADYNGETIAELNGIRYEIYRRFGADDYIELYLGQRVGT